MNYGPDKNKIFPNEKLKELCYVKNVVKRKNIIVGESFMIYYNADGLFTDHDFQYCGAPDDEKYSVDIVG